MAGLAVAFGSTSYFAGSKYLDGQTQARMNQLESRNGSNIELSQIVVATKPMVFGEKLEKEHLKLVPWPKSAVPKGAYTKIEDAVVNGERKIIQPIEENEPVLEIKLTGKNGRAGLAGIIADGMRAVTIPVNSIDGVGGFVLPGDRVDIVFSKRDRASGTQTAKVIMQNVKVLTVDQKAVGRGEGPKVAKTVTLETNSNGAQKLALAKNTGKLSLLLRAAGDISSVDEETITFDDVDQSTAEGEPLEQAEQDKGFLSFLKGEEKKKTVTSVKVVAGDKIVENAVPIDKALKEAPKR